MNTKTLASLGAVAALALSATGCPRRETVHIPNPLVSGAVQPNNIQNPDRETENYYGLGPGTLMDEARLVSLDANQACFQVILRVDGQHANLATPQNWRVFLRGSPSFEDMSPIFGQPAQVQQAVYPGSIPITNTVHTGRYHRVCDANGYCRDEEVVETTTYRQPAQITVVAGGGSVCFANQGHMTPGTSEITLHLDAPGDIGTRLAFRWAFN